MDGFAVAKVTGPKSENRKQKVENRNLANISAFNFPNFYFLERLRRLRGRKMGVNATSRNVLGIHAPLAIVF
jgi:hypothetical protein